MVTLTVLIPVNRLDRAKGRLADVLDVPVREALAIATLRTVERSARGAGFEPVILTADPRVAAAVGPGAHILEEEPALRGLNAQLEHALLRLALDQVLILHADLPLATAEAISALVAAAGPPPSATLVRSPDGGTNAMLLRPPGRFALAYGSNSHALHEAAARSAGLATHTEAVPALELDLDTPADLLTLLALPGAATTLAGKVLDQPDIRAAIAAS